MSINHILTSIPDDEKIDVKFGVVYCDNLISQGSGGDAQIGILDKTHAGFDFEFSAVYDPGPYLQQLYTARRVNSNFYLSCLVEFDRLVGYPGGDSYIYVPIPTSIKEILSTEYPAIIGNNINYFVNGEHTPDSNPTGIYSVGLPGACSYNAVGYEGTHIRVEFKDRNTANQILGKSTCRMEIRFSPNVLV